MASYTKAADVTNAGGTAMEALSCGRSLVLFEPIAAHGRANAESMVRSGLALLSGSRGDLTRVVAELLDDPKLREGRERRSLASARRRGRANDLRALVPLVAGRPRQHALFRVRTRRLRPRRNRQRPPRPAPGRGRCDREAVRPEDAFFLYAQTPTVAQQVGGIAMLERSALTFAAVKEEMQRRLTDLPNLRRRLVPPNRWWRRPAWTLDETIDIADHLDERVLGADGQPGTFTELVDDFFSRPVSLECAPWEILFVQGLDHGATALVVKLHHAMGDGFAAIDALSGLLEDARRPAEPAVVPLVTADGHKGVGGLDVLRAKIRGAGLIVGGLWNIGRGGRAPRSSINGRLRTPSRHLVSLSLPAAEVREVARRLEATTSELVLTVVAEALHRLFAMRGESPQSLLVMVPRTMRTKATRNAPGNWTGGARVAVPAGEMNPLSRLREVQRMLRRSLRYGEPQASRFLMRALGSLPGPLEARVARWSYRSRWFNLIVSVIPGPRRPYSFAGVRLEEVYPVLPLADGVGLAIGVLSWGDSITVGMTTDVTLISDADRLAEEMRAGFFALRGVAAR